MKNPVNFFVIVVLIELVASTQITSQGDLAVTIYNNDFAMIKDTRTIKFDKGESNLYFTDVSANMESQTVTFKAIKDPTSVKVYEQNFDNNVINANSILSKYINKNIQVIAEFGLNNRLVSGILLAQGQNYVLQTTNSVISLNNVAGIYLPGIPDGFFTVPTLNWKVNSNQAQTTSCEVAYRTHGFSWSADYSITLAADEKKVDIGGWVTIDNNSGKKYENAKLKLIAGTVHLAPKPNIIIQEKFSIMMADSRMVGGSASGAPPTFSEKSFADYHLYTLSAPVTLNQSSQKQVEFVPRVYGVDIRKLNKIGISTGGYEQSNIQVGTFIQFNNSAEQKLGIPLPKGVIRVFKEDDADGSLEFIGEDSIDHTPKNQNITVKLGNSFDIVADLILKSKNQISSSVDQEMTLEIMNRPNTFTAELSLTIKNHNKASQQIQLTLNNGYGDNISIDWSFIKATLVKVSSSAYIASFILAAEQIATIQWTQHYNQ